MKRENKKVLYKLIVTAVMAAIAAILMLPVFEIVVPFMPPYIKFDFSDFPALFTGFAAGPLWGVLVCLIKNLIHIPLGTTGGIGEIANFVIGAVYVLTASLIHRKMKTRAGVIIGGIAGSFAMAAAAYPVNLFIVYPAYTRIYFGGSVEKVVETYSKILPWIENLPQALLIFNTPFNIAKGLILTLIAALAYTALLPLLRKLENKFS
ncbi:MAG: ECF transporter S component [Clostridia bacterium]|nr:ECF transporter S component [Clostridia bacterium]